MGVAYHRIHDLEFKTEKPFVKILSSVERATWEAAHESNVRPETDWILLECDYCSRGNAPCDTMIRPHMLNHLLDV
jgi:hypothetical protein